MVNRELRTIKREPRTGTEPEDEPSSKNPEA
jgi:hypothetical protein